MGCVNATPTKHSHNFSQWCSQRQGFNYNRNREHYHRPPLTTPRFTLVHNGRKRGKSLKRSTEQASHPFLQCPQPWPNSGTCTTGVPTPSTQPKSHNHDPSHNPVGRFPDNQFTPLNHECGLLLASCHVGIWVYKCLSVRCIS